MTKDVKFELPAPALEQYTWVLWDEHGPSSRPPLLLGEGPFPGNDPSPLPRSIIVNGFMYMRDGGGFGFGNPFGMPEAPPRSVEDMRRWRQVWLPEVEKVVVQLERFDPRAAPALLDALDRGTDLPEGPRADAFREGFAGLMAEYGATTNADLEDLPTWREDRSIPMAIIRAYARQPDESGPPPAAPPPAPPPPAGGGGPRRRPPAASANVACRSRRSCASWRGRTTPPPPSSRSWRWRRSSCRTSRTITTTPTSAFPPPRAPAG